MRNREYRCVEGVVQVFESPRISISTNEYNAFGLLRNPDSEQWEKVQFDTATEAGKWVDENKDDEVYRIPRQFEIQALKESFDFLFRVYADANPVDFDELSESDMLKSEFNITNVIKIKTAIHECDVFIDASIAKGAKRIFDIKEASNEKA